MRLGDVIDALQDLPADFLIRFAGEGLGVAVPGGFTSYRGIYAHLALTWERDGSCTVAKLLRMAKEADGVEFHGYKGGDFRMDRDTPVWVSKYGESSAWMLLRFEKNLEARIVTAVVENLPWEYRC